MKNGLMSSYIKKFCKKEQLNSLISAKFARIFIKHS